MCEHSIDLVVTYVDDSDDIWRQTLERHADPDDASRFRNWGTLKFWFRAVENNLPFVGKVFIVVSNSEQVPSWLDTGEVETVLHSDLMPSSLLPTFNSTTIEMFLHRIPDLSEHYIYSDDDMFAMRPIPQDAFFDNSGTMLVRTHAKSRPNTTFDHQCWNSYKQAATLMGLHADPCNFICPHHTMVPMSKSACECVFKRSETQIMRRCTKFRQMFNFNQYLFTDYIVLSGQAREGGPHNKLHYLRHASEMEHIVSCGEYDTICFNDNGETSDYQAAAHALQNALATRFPNKSRFEK